MEKYKFDIDLFFVSPEPDNWFDTIEVPLSDSEVDILVNAIIDQKFILPSRPNDDLEGDDYLIIERAPEVRKRILKQMEEEADTRGWKECIPQLDKNANICFGEELWELAESSPRWRLLSEAKENKQVILKRYFLIDREKLIQATESHSWNIIDSTPQFGDAWDGALEGHQEAWIVAFLLWRGRHKISYKKSYVAQKWSAKICISSMLDICDLLQDIVNKWNGTCSYNGDIEINFVPKNDGTDSELLIEIIDRIVQS